MSAQLNTNAISHECTELAQTLSSMLGRVQRRQTVAPATAADGELNTVMLRGLLETAKLTHAFMEACANGYSPQYRARKLLALSDNMPRVVDMIHAMEGEKNLSPLFDRLMNREYKDMYTLVEKLRDTVLADADAIGKQIPPPSKTVELAVTFMFLPLAITLGVMAGLAQGVKEAMSEPKKREPEPPKRHLSLVQNT